MTAKTDTTTAPTTTMQPIHGTVLTRTGDKEYQNMGIVRAIQDKKKFILQQLNYETTAKEYPWITIPIIQVDDVDEWVKNNSVTTSQ